ncbi:hypothetical protein ABMA27_014389 [Loxostege sticticalis]|uniref:Uncharacterized protein n=1 Tax=Loxostege sticticalis TaxID=481309 RepID=A0ABR3I8R2_LOXSC
MPKRKAEEKIKRYKEKIKKLEEKQKVHKRRRNIIISDSESDIENQDIQLPENYNVEDIENTNYDYHNVPDDSLPLIPSTISLSSAPILCEPSHSPVNAEETKNDVESSDAPQPPLEQINVVPETSNDAPIELDPEIRLALGDPIADSPKYGANIHNDLAQRWLPILKKGLTKEAKDNLLKQHHVPDNCRLLKSPCLNPEIAAAVAEAVRARDKKMEVKQNQLGLGITAISRAMEIILNEGNKIEVIKYLSEGCRILTDLHYTETQIRTKCITPDEFLFGSKLSEKIKAAKAIEKQGWQIKRNIPQKMNQNQPQSKIRPTGNWTPPPPRYPSSVSRGGAQFRPQAPPPPPPAVQSQARTATVSRQRAQTRQ